MAQALIQSGFIVEREDNVDALIKYKKPEPIYVELSNLRIAIYFAHSSSHGQFDESICQSVIVTFECTEKLGLATWMRQWVIPMQELLTLLIGVPCQITSTEVRVPDHDNRLGGHDRYISAVYRPWRRIAIPVDRDRGPKEYGLVPSWEALGRWQELVSKWFLLREELDSVIDLYLYSKFHQSAFQFLDAEFLNAAQVLESYHGRRPFEKALDKDTAKIVRKAAIEAVADQYRSRVQQSLMRIQEKTFSERLLELFNARPSLFEVIDCDIDEFALRVKNTRNYLVHLEPRLDRKRLKGSDLLDARDLLWSVFECLVLEELGFDKSDAIRLVMVTNRFQQIGKWWKINKS